MSRIRCTECGKHWIDQEAYKADQGCDKSWCKNTEEVIEMGRRRGRGVKAAPTEVVNEHGIRQVRLHTHTSTHQVLSKWNEKEPVEKIKVPDAIQINIFLR